MISIPQDVLIIALSSGIGMAIGAFIAVIFIWKEDVRIAIYGALACFVATFIIYLLISKFQGKI